MLYLIFALGACVGSLLNLLIYRLGPRKQDTSPWTPAAWRLPIEPPHRRKGKRVAELPSRQLIDRVPIVGWFTLARETEFRGTLFWLRPLFVELLTAALFAFLYQWEVVGHQLYPLQVRAALPAAGVPSWQVPLQFAFHLVLISVMIVATFIDFDDTVIPDSVTVPGAIFALITAAMWPTTQLPILDFLPIPPVGRFELAFLQTTSPAFWPQEMDTWLGLAIGIFCWLAWCVALRLGAAYVYVASWLRRRRRSNNFVRWRRWVRRSILRDPILYLAPCGLPGVALVWNLGGNAWHGLFSALVGMAAGGALVWIVRIIGQAVLKQEAMGFGDVTLLAMIGAFLGWQTAIMVFFLSPLCGIVLGLALYVIRRQRAIPFGPFICLAALVILIFWPDVWYRAQGAFDLGWMLVAILAGGMVVMGILLYIVQGIKRLFGWQDDPAAE